MQITFQPQKDQDINEETRLVIYDIENKSFHSTYIINKDEVLQLEDREVLNNPWNFKYKYQVKENTKWIDKTSYLKFSGNQDLEKFILDKIKLKDPDEFDNLVSSLITSSSQRNTLYRSIPLFMRQLWIKQDSPHPNMEKLLIALKAKNGYEPNFLGNLTFYLEKHLLIKKKLTQSSLFRQSYHSIFPDCAGDQDFYHFLEEILKECAKYHSTLQLSNVLSGMIHSFLGRRDEAIIKFNDALQFEEDHIAALRFDQGIHTYSEMNDTYELPNSVEFLSEDTGKSQSEIILLMSMDIRFLRLYGINILFTASVLKQYQFHFHIIGEREEVKSCVAETMDLFEKMCKYRGNISPVIAPTFSTEKVPEGITDEKTFYACARFLRAAYFMDHFDTNLYICDADLFITSDPGDYFKKLLNFEIGLPFSIGVMNLSPWRRVLAGNVFLKNGEHSREFVSMVSSYILTNIYKSYTWTLDQNALAYTFENYAMNGKHELIGNLNPLERPFYQPLIRKNIEQ
ncbi:hypothetical protein, partial [Neobacillus vireti]|uniref:hypothetical protein n=1 Tax=Neobacillus vireti TaxID=220686 RepID=UPI002FFFF4A1